MWTYILICLSLTLAGVAGLQLLYTAFLCQVQKEHLKHIRILEMRNRSLTNSLNKLGPQAAGVRDFIGSVGASEERVDVPQEEIWVDVIEER